MSKLEVVAEIDGTSPPRKRLFETGEMKLLVLHFISQQPKYSYDIIKDVAALVGGNYKPSTGTICPTINYLEEQGYTHVQLSEDERKQYHINAKGLEHLQAQQDRLNKVLLRFNTRNKIQNDDQYIAIKDAMDRLKTALRTNILHGEHSEKHIVRIAEYIEEAAAKIEKLAEK